MLLQVILNKILPIISILLFLQKATGQGSRTARSIPVHKTTSKIIVDGIMNEDVWQTAALVDSFINK
jgi:ribosomal protein L6P/L9E